MLGAAAAAEEKREPVSEDILVQGTRAPDRYLLGWHEYTSQHFVVDSDLASWAVPDLIRRLEKLRAMEVRSFLAESVAMPGRVRVIASSLSLLFSELARDEYSTGSSLHCQIYQLSCTRLLHDQLFDPCGFFGRCPRGGCDDDDLFVAANYFVSRLGEPTIVLPAAGGRVNSEVIAHEIAHHLASFLFLHPPPWFREGFASFMQTLGGEPLQNPPRTGTHIPSGERVLEGAVGLAPPGFMAGLCRDWVSAGAALNWNGEESSTRRNRYHTQSWLLYHWLWNTRPKQLLEFQHRLASAENADLAWREVFPEFDPQRPGALESLDKALLRYQLDLGGRYYRRKVEVEARYTETPLRPSDVHVLLIDARYSVQPQKGHSAEWLSPELIKLLQEEPLQPVAISWRAELDRTAPVEPLRKAVEKWPADWRAWLLLGRAEEDSAKKLAAYQTAVKLNPDSVLAQTSLAVLLATSDHPSDALPSAKRAVDLAPWDAHAVTALARADAALGACEEAIEMHNRAVRLGAEADLFQALNEVAARCPPSRD